MAAMLTSIYHLFILAMNNYVGIVRPLHYSITVTPERTVVLIVILWILPLFILFLFFGIVPNQAFQSPKCSNLGFFVGFNFRLVVLGVFVLPLTLMSFMYAHILLVIIKRKTATYLGRTPRQTPPISAKNGQLKHRQFSPKALITTTLILGTFLIGWMPSVVAFFIVCQNGCPVNYANLIRHNPKVVLIYSLIVNLLIILKALADAMIYAARVREIQTAIRQMHLSCGCSAFTNRFIGSQTDMTGRGDTVNFSSLRGTIESRRNSRM